MFIGICPFLQCKRTNRFICQRKYIQIIWINTVIYLAYVIYLNSYELPKLFHTDPNLRIILKFCHYFVNSYLVFLEMGFIVPKRQSHADYYNRLYEFDYIYDELIEPPMKYKNINRMFWIELFVYGVNILVKWYVQYVSQLYIFDGESFAYRINTSSEQFIFALILFYMKNCAHNLIVRFRKVNSLLYKFLTISKKCNKTSTTENCPNFQLEKLEKIATMFNILIGARNNLQITFGSAFVVIFTFNLFGIAFNAYQVFDIYLNVNGETREISDKDPFYVGVVYVIIYLPLFIVFFYSMIYYHFLGNAVRLYK